MAGKKTYTSLTSLHRPQYGKWGGNPRGHNADPSRCVESVCSNDRGSLPHQCNNKRGYGPEEAYCKIHSPEYVNAKLKKELDAYNAKTAKWAKESRLKNSRDRLVEALEEIATGHNDPRTLATETMAAVDHFMATGDWPD